MCLPASNWKLKKERLKLVRDLFASSNKISGGKFPEQGWWLSNVFVWLSFSSMKDSFTSGIMLVLSMNKEEEGRAKCKGSCQRSLLKFFWKPQTKVRRGSHGHPTSIGGTSIEKQESLFPTCILVEEAEWKGSEAGGQEASLQYLPTLIGGFSLTDSLSCGIILSKQKKFSVQKL